MRGQVPVHLGSCHSCWRLQGHCVHKATAANVWMRAATPAPLLPASSMCAGIQRSIAVDQLLHERLELIANQARLYHLQHSPDAREKLARCAGGRADEGAAAAVARAVVVAAGGRRLKGGSTECGAGRPLC